MYRSGRKQVFDALLAADRPLTAVELSTLLDGAARRHVERVLQRLINEKLVELVGRETGRTEPGNPAKVFAPSSHGRTVGNDYVPPTDRQAHSNWGEYSARRLAIVRELLGADAAGLMTSGIARLTRSSSHNVRTVLNFGLDRGLVRRTILTESPVTYTYSLTPDGITAAIAYLRAYSCTNMHVELKVSLDPATADLPAALALLEQLRGMPGVTVS